VAAIDGTYDARPGVDDEGRDWREWLDRRPHRLKRGKHYVGDPKAVVRRARVAANELGKVAVASLDSSGKYEYLWIQFVDGEIGPGRPCPVCGGTALEKVQKRFLRCSTCDARLKADDAWEVAAGEFPFPAPQGPAEGLAPEGEPKVPRGDSYLAILGTHVLSSDGAESSSPSIEDDFLIQLGFRFHKPVDWALPQVRLAVEGLGAAIRVHPPRPLRVPHPQTIEARFRVPGHLLPPKRYTVEVIVRVVPDSARPDEMFKVAERNTLTFEVARAEESDESIMERELASPLEWEIVSRPHVPA